MDPQNEPSITICIFDGAVTYYIYYNSSTKSIKYIGSLDDCNICYILTHTHTHMMKHSLISISFNFPIT